MQFEQKKTIQNKSWKRTKIPNANGDQRGFECATKKPRQWDLYKRFRPVTKIRQFLTSRGQKTRFLRRSSNDINKKTKKFNISNTFQMLSLFICPPVSLPTTNRQQGKLKCGVEKTNISAADFLLAAFFNSKGQQNSMKTYCALSNNLNQNSAKLFCGWFDWNFI